MKKDMQKLLIDRRDFFDEQKPKRVYPHAKVETGKL